MPEGLKIRTRSLEGRERAAFGVLAAFAGAVLLFAFGAHAGGAFHQALN